MCLQRPSEHTVTLRRADERPYFLLLGTLGRFPRVVYAESAPALLMRVSMRQRRNTGVCHEDLPLVAVVVVFFMGFVNRG